MKTSPGDKKTSEKKLFTRLNIALVSIFCS